jgi:DNA repair photolyase
MVGTPEKVLQGIRKYLDIGVRHFILHFIGLNNAALRLFDSKVITRIQKHYRSSSANSNTGKDKEEHLAKRYDLK